MTDPAQGRRAIELFHRDGTSAQIFYCSECRVVARSEDDAQRCCDRKAARVAIADYAHSVVYLEGSDRYISVDDLADEIADADKPLRIYGVREVKMGLDADSVIERGCEQLHEDALDDITVAAREEMQTFLTSWEAEHAPNCYEQDCGVVIDLGSDPEREG